MFQNVFRFKIGKVSQRAVLREGYPTPESAYQWGTRASNIMEHQLAVATGMQRPDNRNASYDLVSDDGQCYEVRLAHPKRSFNLTKSAQMGAGRSFDPERYEAYLETLAGFYICDTADFPLINVYFLYSHEALDLFERRYLRSGRMARQDFLKIRDPLCQLPTITI